MEFSLCPNYYLPNRTLGDTISTLCSDSTLLGRVILGLYGNLVPRTVSNFKSLCISASSSNPNSSSYKNTLVHKVLQGQYFLAGRQGRPDRGEVRPPSYLPRNVETVDPKAFTLTHSRPGTVSLSLSENDDEDEIKFDPEYRNVEFLITTGPGPCPQLDNKNIVFGTVLEGNYFFNVCDVLKIGNVCRTNYILLVVIPFERVYSILQHFITLYLNQ
jgi:peptidyl-prolyl cis-trans isomerase B (cyclophilin B)